MGRRKCVVPYCVSRAGDDDNASFHEFPADFIQRDLWLKNIFGGKPEDPLEAWVSVSDRDCVCSKHFTPKDFRVDTIKRILLKNAIPTVFDGYPALKKTVRRAKQSPLPKQKMEVLPIKLERSCLAETYIPFPITPWEPSEDDIRESPSFSDAKSANNQSTTFTESEWT